MTAVNMSVSMDLELAIALKKRADKEKMRLSPFIVEVIKKGLEM